LASSAAAAAVAASGEVVTSSFSWFSTCQQATCATAQQGLGFRVFVKYPIGSAPRLTRG
jgi:hypothetical protein